MTRTSRESSIMINGYSGVRPAGLSDDEYDSDSSYIFQNLNRQTNNVSYEPKQPVPGYSGRSWNDDESSSSSEEEESDGSLESTPIELVIHACTRGDVGELKTLLLTYNRGIDELFRDSDLTPLATACLNGNLEVVKFLLEEKSADPNKGNPIKKLTPLMAVAGSSFPKDELLMECVMALVKAGADVNLKCEAEITALMIACKKGRKLVVECLLNHGAIVDSSDFDGRTALFVAASQGDGLICKVLLKHGADLNLADKYGWTALEIAQENGFTDLAEFLYKISTKTEQGADPLNMLDEIVGSEDSVIDTQFDDLELSPVEVLLWASEGQQYLSKFETRKITYTQVLSFNENKLKEIGVDKYGVRQKILDNIKKVHMTEWRTTSLNNVNSNQMVTSAELNCILQTTNTHLNCLGSSIAFANERVKPLSDILLLDEEKNKAKQLVKYCQIMLDECDGIEETVGEILEFLKKAQKEYNELRIAGKICCIGLKAPLGENRTKNGEHWSTKRWSTLSLFGSAAFALLFWLKR